MIYKWPQSIQSLIYPPRCLLCCAPGETRDLCPACLADLPYNLHHCRCCALSLPVDTPKTALCGECQKSPPLFDRCHAPFIYGHPVNHMISGLKFRDKLLYGRLLADLLGESIAQQPMERPELLIPVPLHRERLRSRGYNQAVELGRPLARRFSIPLDLHSCRRIKATPPQSDLAQKERRKNLRNAFSVNHKIQARHVVLVDDVVTTGSTVSELAKTLKRAGVERVDVWALARTP